MSHVNPVRGADDGIKPGVSASEPRGTDPDRFSKVREAAGSRVHLRTDQLTMYRPPAASRAHGFLGLLTWGSAALHPRLYASVRSADCLK